MGATGSPSGPACTTSPTRSWARSPLRDLRSDREHRLGQCGTDHDTGAFAVASIRSWWNGPAWRPTARRRLLITADTGGSNGSRLRLWKTELAAFAAAAGLDITVLHLPPGTSKWNRIEHRLFSAITMNWRGLLAGLPRGHHRDDQRGHHQDRPEGHRRPGHQHLPKGIRIPDKDMKAFEARHLQRHEFHGNWNYTIPAEPPAKRHARMKGINYCASAKSPGDSRSPAIWGRYWRNRWMSARAMISRTRLDVVTVARPGCSATLKCRIEGPQA